MPPETLSQFWLENVRRYRGSAKIAVRQKNLGIWQAYSWEQEYAQVSAFSQGLLELGLQAGDRVAIIGDNDCEYLWGALAIMAAGAAVVGIFTDVTPREVEYIVTHADATFVLAGDQEQCDKLLEIKPNLPLVKRVIYWDDRGLWSYQDSWLMPFQAVQELGQQAAAQEPARFDALVARGKKDDAAMFCYTSGTTGLPKGAMLSHGNFTYAVAAFGEIDPRRDSDNYVSFIPMAWIGGAALDIAPHTVDGVILNFAEGPATVQQNIREISPDSLLYNSRLWENLVATIRARMLDSSTINRLLYRLFLPVGYKVADFQFRKQPAPLLWRLLYQLGNLIVFHPLRSQFGLHKARAAYTAGAALSPDVMRFFQALGLSIQQIYGSTEITGGAVTHRHGDIKFESLGAPLTGSAMRISTAGEILLAGPGLFLGYHKDPQATAAVIEVDDRGVRWFHTGDAGHIDEDGHLIYLDRMKDMIELSSGDRYSPQYIEGRLKFSPYISHALTLGGPQQRFVAALITIDFDNVGRWAEKRGLAFTTYTDLAQKPEVYELIRQDVAEVNHTLPTPARVHKFVLLHKEFDADEGEMTRTRKLRRAFLAERYADIIAAIYAGLPAANVSATVTYRDGRESVIATTLRIETP
ncbi:MAG: AMP-binding protein [Anaerolineae bacterium]